MHLLRLVITLFTLLSFFRRSSVSSCFYLSTASTSHTFQPYQTACQACAYLMHFSPIFLLIAAHRRPLRRCSPFLLPAFFSLVTLSLIQDLLTLKLPQSKISFFNIYRPPSSSSFSKPFSPFLDEFNSFLSVAATTPHEFVITGDFNIHLDNPSDHATSQFLSVLSSFNLIQYVNFPTHGRNHILDLVITSADSSLVLSLSTSSCSSSDHFPIFTKLSTLLHHSPLQRNIHFAAYTLLTLMIFSQMCCKPPPSLRNLSTLSCSRTTPFFLHY